MGNWLKLFFSCDSHVKLFTVRPLWDFFLINTVVGDFIFFLKSWPSVQSCYFQQLFTDKRQSSDLQEKSVFSFSVELGKKVVNLTLDINKIRNWIFFS